MLRVPDKFRRGWNARQFWNFVSRVIRMESAFFDDKPETWEWVRAFKNSRNH